MLSNRRCEFVEAQFLSEPGVGKLFGRKITELSVELKHELRKGLELEVERFETIAHLHEHGCQDPTLARTPLEPQLLELTCILKLKGGRCSSKPRHDVW